MPRPVLSVISVAFLSTGARSATLPNELSTSAPLTVAARGAVGPYYRPGAWMVLKITIENSGDPFAATVRVRETRGRRETFFVGAARTELRRGTSSLEVVVAPGGPAAGTALEIARAGRDAVAGEVVYRGDLSRVLRPLGPRQRLVLGVGLRAFPAHLAPRSVVWTLDPRELPRKAEAYGGVDLVVIEEAGRRSVSAAQARALLDHVRGGGVLVLASFRSLAALGLSRSEMEPWAHWDVTGEGDKPDRSPDYRVYSLGCSWLYVFAAEAGDDSAWKAKEAVRLFLKGVVSASDDAPLIDAQAFDALAPERAFQTAASRARVVVVASALLVTVAVALMARARRRTAAAAIGGVAVAWAVVSMLVWQKPSAAARIVRVRAFTADGRAELVTDTAALVAFDKATDLAFETDTGPALPVARRAGEAFGKAFVLEGRGEGWSMSSLRCAPGGVTLARAVSARAVGADSEKIRMQALARGNRAKVAKLSGGRRKVEPGSGEMPRAVRYLLERFAPPAEEVAWAWVAGTPEGARCPGCDEAPGSGTLLVAGVRRRSAAARGPPAGHRKGPPGPD